MSRRIGWRLLALVLVATAAVSLRFFSQDSSKVAPSLQFQIPDVVEEVVARSTIEVLVPIKNQGNRSELLAEVETGCGCVTGELTKGNLKPGQSTVLKLMIDSPFGATGDGQSLSTIVKSIPFRVNGGFGTFSGNVKCVFHSPVRTKDGGAIELRVDRSEGDLMKSDVQLEIANGLQVVSLISGVTGLTWDVTPHYLTQPVEQANRSVSFVVTATRELLEAAMQGRLYTFVDVELSNLHGARSYVRLPVHVDSRRFVSSVPRAVLVTSTEVKAGVRRQITLKSEHATILNISSSVAPVGHWQIEKANDLQHEFLLMLSVSESESSLSRATAHFDVWLEGRTGKRFQERVEVPLVSVSN